MNKDAIFKLLEKIHRYQREDRALLRNHAKILADHCSRLLKEKTTLQRQVEELRLRATPTLTEIRRA